MINTLTCKDCGYCYMGMDDDFPRCHWGEDAYDPDGTAPCEEEYDDEEDC